MGTAGSDLHDAYALDYDAQVDAYECYVADLLFGLAYEYIEPGQRLLDIGIGSGLSAWPFAKAGLEISGMDFSPVMLDICKSKGLAKDLTLHDLDPRSTHLLVSSRGFSTSSPWGQVGLSPHR